jgi:hypothetical protein
MIHARGKYQLKHVGSFPPPKKNIVISPFHYTIFKMKIVYVCIQDAYTRIFKIKFGIKFLISWIACKKSGEQ